VGLLVLAGTAAMPPADYEFHTFPFPDAFFNEPFGLMNQGLATGFYSSATAEHGFLYTAAGGYVTVDVPLPEVVGTQLYQANQHGEIAVSFYTADGKGYGAVYDLPSKTWSYLPDPDPSSVFSGTAGINDRGQLFGNWCDNPSFLNNHGWVYEHGLYTFFDAPGASPDNYGTLVFAANNRGDVVGSFWDSQGGRHGFIRYGQSGRVETIDAPDGVPGGTSVYGINDQGTIVGRYTDAGGSLHGFIRNNGVYTTLDAPGAVNTSLSAINERGDIAGFSWQSDDSRDIPFIASRRGK
jgi:uncharacterized membrane protein